MFHEIRDFYSQILEKMVMCNMHFTFKCKCLQDLVENVNFRPKTHPLALKDLDLLLASAFSDFIALTYQYPIKLTKILT